MCKKNFKCTATGGAEWSAAVWVSFADGERKVELGRWQRTYDPVTGNHVGYEALDTSGYDAGLQSRPSSGQISARESELNAGTVFLHGRSRTAGYDELRRISRVHPRTGAALPPEDAVERVTEKVRLWPCSANFVTGDRAIRAYPQAAAAR